MLLESLIRKTLDVKDHRVKRVEGDESRLVVHLERKLLHKLPCSCCGERRWCYDTLRQREWQHVPLWGIAVTLVYAPRRVDCPTCGVKVEHIPWGPTKSSLSLPLVILLATWSKLLALNVVAALFGVSWATVASAVKQAVEYGLKHRKTAAVEYLGIDEVSRRKGHVYHTQVYDLARKRLLWSKQGREKDVLEAFFREWSPARTARLKGICCDMWAPYIDVVREQAPQAVLVFDKFHLVRHLLDAVNRVRKEEAKSLKPNHPELLQGTKYIWLKNPWNLTPRQQERLGFLERLNLKINRAYLLKEAFRRLWDCQGQGWAKRYLDKWFWWATHSRLKPLRDFAWLLRRHQEGVLAWFKVPIDNGATEALNNNAKELSHRARGFRTEKWFTTIMLHGMGQLPLPQTTHIFF